MSCSTHTPTPKPHPKPTSSALQIVGVIALCTPLHSVSFFKSNVAFALFYGGCVLLGGALSLLAEKLMVVITSSLGGSFIFFMGLCSSSDRGRGRGEGEKEREHAAMQFGTADRLGCGFHRRRARARLLCEEPLWTGSALCAPPL